jgi:hypothetical protein
MPDIVIQGTTISFPDSGTSPNWAPAVIQFAESVATALTSSVGTYDIAPQNYVIDLHNAVSNQNIPALTFPTSQVRGALIRYAVYRTSTTQVAAESGLMQAIYNSNAGTWELSRDYVGDGKIAFNITNTGQVQFSTNAADGTTAASLTGTNHQGKIIFAAQSLLQN